MSVIKTLGLIFVTMVAFAKADVCLQGCAAGYIMCTQQGKTTNECGMQLIMCQQGCPKSLAQTPSVFNLIKSLVDQGTAQRAEFDKADTNKDGYIQFDEFIKVLESEGADMKYRSVYV